MTDAASPLFQQFQNAIDDLWWMSETDAPIEVSTYSDIFADGFSLPELLALNEHEPELPSEEVSLDRLFEPAIREQDWHGDLEKEDVRRFRALKSLITESLIEVRVIRVGEVNLDIYVLGKANERDWMILSTQAVET